MPDPSLPKYIYKTTPTDLDSNEVAIFVIADFPRRLVINPEVDFMKPFWPKFTD
jgi:hypothetical protein